MVLGKVMLEENTTVEREWVEEMPSLNHSYICAQLMRQLLDNERIQPLPELTLDVENGLTPDISIYPREKIHPNFFEDVLKIKEMPVLAIEVISSSQSIRAVLEKAKLLVDAGVNTVWTVEPYGRSIFVLDARGKRLFREEVVESEGIRVDFSKVFG
jgi:Uma2 family endonuclease